jgi:hypothetical protein
VGERRPEKKEVEEEEKEIVKIQKLRPYQALSNGRHAF